MVSRNRLIAFIQNAEMAWERVVFSYDLNSKPIRIGDFDYYKLPLRFSTRIKIFRYYRQFWNSLYANRMICSAGFKNIRGRLYSPDADTGGLTSRVLELKIKNQSSTNIIVDAILGMPGDSIDDGETVRYSILRNPTTEVLTINLRRSRFADYRYDPCIKGSRILKRKK